MDYSQRQAQAMLGKHVTYHKESCPLATTDVHENTKNRIGPLRILIMVL